MNPIITISTLLIVTFSLLCSVEALLCVMCSHFNSTKHCVTHSGYCLTKRDQKCLLLTVSSGESLIYGAQTCWTHCVNKYLLRGNVKEEHKCCDSQRLCNQF
ncbi:prostate and testis expressed protein 14-like [Apodemus sylvaticus]|uniref:prostate and testis expressed protein 14-like n=1 Tax=Apodemus sylvaticus TaxID=10129 RepID=UPI002242DD73|nr:prostate and testis expressed protein 14-like [Apodemus sylvaticus]